MIENSMKLRVAISCWLLIFCWVLPHHVDGASQHSETIDGILRSVAAVRAQLEPVLRNRVVQRTTFLPPVARVEPDGVGANRRTPGLLQFIRGASRKQPTSTTTVASVSVTIPSEAIVDVTQPAAPETTTMRSRPTTSGRRRIKTKRPTEVRLNTTRRPVNTEPNEDELRANPLGLIIPSSDQVNFFQQQWQRQPYLRPSKPSPTFTSTTSPPQGVDFYFPRDSEEDQGQVPGLGAFSPVTRFGMTTAATTRSSTVKTSTSTPVTSASTGTKSMVTSTSPTPKITIEPVEEETTEPPEEEGLGNRIDQKVLLSLLG
uniref:Uncharacterized protein n=1 Tax=Anopheles atroparvus TaxID=41427 RepID=A0AAG5D0C1_ANOAO